MTTIPRVTADDQVVSRVVTAVHVSLALFVAFALSRGPLDLELSRSGECALLALVVAAGVALAVRRGRRES